MRVRPVRDRRTQAAAQGLCHAQLVDRARRRMVRILDGWPTTDVLLGAYQRIQLLS